MVEFKLIDYKNQEKQKIIIDGFLKNAKQDDKLMFNCIITGEFSTRTISSLVKRGIDYKNIDLHDETIFISKKESLKLLNKKKFGVENQFQRNEIINKIKEKKRIAKEQSGDKLFDLSLFDNIEFICNICGKKTCVQKRSYTDNICKECKQKQTVSKNIFKTIEKRLADNNLTLIDNYVKQRDENNIFYAFKCNVCGNIFTDHLHSNIPNCPICFPRFTSKPELEVASFIQELGFDVIKNDRNILDGFEIDVFIPEKNIGVEFNGLFWHSELKGGKSKTYHYIKKKKAEEKGVYLIQIFEDEWNLKKEIVKSILKNKLGIIDKKIYARKCSIELVKNIEAHYFYKNNHLQGGIYSFINIGLFYNNDLVSCLSFSKSRFKKTSIEITRFANILNTSVIGGFSKLLKYFIKEYDYPLITTYSDRRFFNGNLYKNNGFSYVGSSQPGYFYLDKNYSRRLNRFNFQKHKLPNILSNFDENLTEWENMQNNNYDRIWDCGNEIFELKGGKK